MNSTTATTPPQPPIVLQPLRWVDPWRWLRLGWADMRASPGISLFYGACFWAMALVLG